MEADYGTYVVWNTAHIRIHFQYCQLTITGDISREVLHHTTGTIIVQQEYKNSTKTDHKRQPKARIHAQISRKFSPVNVVRSAPSRKAGRIALGIA